MNINIGNKGLINVLSCFKDNIENSENSIVSFATENKLFEGNNKDFYSYLTKDENLILLGLGEKDKVSLDSIKNAFYTLGEKARDLKLTSLNIDVPNDTGLDYIDVVKAISEGLLHSTYSFDKYLTKKKTTNTVTDVFLNIEAKYEADATTAINETKNLIDGIFLARDLTNEPAMVITPDALSNIAKSELTKLGVDVEVLDEKQIEKLNMNAFLAVAKGSDNPPRFIIMKWNGNPDSDEKIALVGKGLTYDSGGYSIKPTDSMITMSSDMAGSATVIGTMKALATSKVKKNVVAIVAACENLISGKAYKPGDILTSMSGKTIEILNTDAEGRLTLADALWYAATVEKADKIIDIATLTGACIMALGDTFTGAITNDDNLMNMVLKASKKACEPVWELPSHDDFRDHIKGTFADLANSSKKGAGTITAGLFLEEFVDDKPWVHLDIAGTSYLSSKRGYLPKGATGVHVKTLYHLVSDN